jgi:hypothetical protein
MAEFHETRAGRTFYERDVPEIARHLARIAQALEHLAHAAGAPPPTTESAPAEGEDPRGADADEPRTET